MSSTGPTLLGLGATVVANDGKFYAIESEIVG